MSNSLATIIVPRNLNGKLRVELEPMQMATYMNVGNGTWKRNPNLKR